MDQVEAYSGHSIWVTELVEGVRSRVPLPTAPAVLLTIGTLPFGLTGLFFLLADGRSSPYVLFIHLLTAVIPSVAPLLVWHYDENVFPTFIQEVSDVVQDHQSLIETVDRYEQFFVDRYWVITVPWTVLIIGVAVANIGFFRNLGVTGVGDPAFLVYMVFALWFSIITGIGLHGALTTILCVRAVGDLELTIDPLHHDGLGGLSTIGYFSIRATLMNSIGSFALPLAFSIAAEGNYQELVYLAVAGYIGFILLSFVYPTLYVNRRAQAVRESVLKTKRRQIQELRRQATVDSTGGELSELETQLKIQTLRDDFNEYQSINLYPLSISILTRLASSILLPIAFTLLETYVFSG